MAPKKLNVRPYDNKQSLLFPPAVRDFLSGDHPALVVDEIVETLDLSRFYAKVPDVGNPSYDPDMMVKIMVYSHLVGVRSSRKMAKLLETDVAFIYLAGMQKPNFRTLCDFRKNHREELRDLLKKVVEMCRDLRMVGLKHVAVDGTVMKGNASASKMYDEERLEKEIDKALKEAEEEDEREDKEYGYDKRGDELPEEIRDKEARRKKIQELIKKLEEKEQEESQQEEERKEEEKKKKKKKKGGKKKGSKKINATDPDAVLQKTGGGYKVGYRMECAVDEQEGVIIASDVSNDKRDTKQLMGLLDQTEETLSEQIRQKKEAGQMIAVTADSGFSSLENLHALENRPLYDAHIPDQAYQTTQRKKEGKNEFHKDKFVYDEETDVYICPAGAILKRQAERIKDGQKATIYGADKGRCKACEHFGQCTKNAAGRTLWRYEGEELKDKMRQKLDQKASKEIYRRRKQVAERTFADTKEKMGFRDFQLRGLDGVKTEGLWMVISYNISRIYHYLKRCRKTLKEMLGGELKTKGMECEPILTT